MHRIPHHIQPEDERSGRFRLVDQDGVVLIESSSVPRPPAPPQPPKNVSCTHLALEVTSCVLAGLGLGGLLVSFLVHIWPVIRANA